ncbi:MAG TPA: hypothetical protein PLV68_15620, partial [Ilumatobacteraceae bacterium]|nr:hypothetical protein [Ilumatobacteraceae bacterium]
RVAVLGPTGRNFAAGMSGGVAYVYDPQADFAARVNPELVALEELDPADEAELVAMVTSHRDHTGSTVAAAILADWDVARASFRKVMPRDYKRVLAVMQAAAAEGLDEAAAAARVMETV